MVLSRRLLFRSAFWELARPRHPLTAGHVVLRLSDPSVEFTESSAADWLYCHGLARTALREVLGASRCSVMFAHLWHPLGDAVGEPVAESSTPTFHLFARWHGETTTPGRQLALPAYRRVAEPEEDLDLVDHGLRESVRAAASGLQAPLPGPGGGAEPGAGVVPDAQHTPLVATVDAGRNHLVFEPASGAPGIADVLPGELVALGAALGSLPLSSRSSGYSCVAVEAPDPGGSLRVHAVGRSAAEEASPMLDVFRLPEVSLALL